MALGPSWRTLLFTLSHTKEENSGIQNLYMLLARSATGPERDSEKYTTKTFYC